MSKITCTIDEQRDAIALYLVDPTRRADPDGAWCITRRRWREVRELVRQITGQEATT